MTRQEMFDKAARGVIAQGGPSGVRRFNAIYCKYRGPNGRKCAIGHLIEDDEAAETLDACSVAQTVGALARRGFLFSVKDADFLQRIQSAHDIAALSDDERFIREFREAMRGIAARYDLSPAVLDEPPAAAQFATRMETGK